MAYASLAELKAYAGIDSSGDDTLLTALLARAQAIIDSHCRRTFEAAADSTRYFDAEDDVDDDDLIVDTDLYSVTSVTNGDGTAVAASEYVLEPANHRPAYAICLKENSSVVWTWSDSPENAISVTGRWAYSLTAPADITHACIRLAAWLYRQKDNSADVDAVNVTSGGAVIVPSGLPNDVTLLLRVYVR